MNFKYKLSDMRIRGRKSDRPDNEIKKYYELLPCGRSCH